MLFRSNLNVEGDHYFSFNMADLIVLLSHARPDRSPIKHAAAVGSRSLLLHSYMRMEETYIDSCTVRASVYVYAYDMDAANLQQLKKMTGRYIDTFSRSCQNIAALRAIIRPVRHVVRTWYIQPNYLQQVQANDSTIVSYIIQMMQRRVRKSAWT